MKSIYLLDWTEEAVEDEEEVSKNNAQLVESLDKFSLTNMEELQQINTILTVASQKLSSDDQV